MGVAGEQLGRRASARLVLEIDIRERLPGAVFYDEGCTDVLDGPRRREAACSHLADENNKLSQQRKISSTALVYRV